MKEKPCVSIVCTVYNKAKWLSETLDAFLLQKTDFSFEILVIDDASTDHSKEIIDRYAQEHPELIRVFSNEENLGIARTWKKICLEAQGHYIARCDGDDIWTDAFKLQKQVDALKKQPEYRWCSTDISYIGDDGQMLEAAVFKNKQLSFIRHYEDMLATRGFTAPSTWLVERELMLAVNEELDTTTADDTFNLQLDLFQRTERLYLEDVTVAYRINLGSDSRPKDFNLLKKRFDRLLETQLEYVDKYPQVDFKQMTQILLKRNNTYELQLSKPKDSLSHIGLEYVTVYFADEEGVFNQKDILQKLIVPEDSMTFTVTDKVRKIRIDLSERPSYFSKVLLTDKQGTVYHPIYTNGLIDFDCYLFPNEDPQLIYEFDHLAERELTLEYSMINIDDSFSENYIGRFLINYMEEVSGYTPLINELKEQLSDSAQQYEDLNAQYHAVINSRRWIWATKLINLLKKRK